MLQAPDVSEGRTWSLLAVAATYAIASAASRLLFPQKVAEVWDEQNTAAHRNSLVCGYWAAIIVFVILLRLIWTDRINAAHAIFWLGPVLAIAPPAHDLGSILRGRAE
jgi:uncharacterized membrane protein